MSHETPQAAEEDRPNHNRRPSISRRGFLRTAATAGAALTLGRILPQSLFGAEAGKRPNILFFFPDQHRPDWLSLTAGLPVRTPNLAALAQRGVRFTNAICPSPVCAPSRAALACGREYDRCGVAGNNQSYRTSMTSFYKLLRGAGYHVLGCGKFDLRKPEESWGADGKQLVNGVSYMDLWGFSDGIDNSGKYDGIRAARTGKPCPYLTYLKSQGLLDTHLDDFAHRKMYDGKVTPLTDEAYCDNWIARNGLKLLAAAPAGKPWFLQINFNGPHNPQDVTAAMKQRWKDVKFPLPHEAPDGYDHDGIRQNYSAMVENIDRWLGLYIDELKKTGQYDNTLIVYSSDHGEMLGDHGRWAKTVPYQASASVPLIVGGPGIREGWVCNGPAATLDLAATFLDVAAVPTPADMDSRSMLPMLAGKTDQGRSVVRSGLANWRLAFDGRYKLIKGFDPNGRKGGDEEGGSGGGGKKAAAIKNAATGKQADADAAAVSNIRATAPAGKPSASLAATRPAGEKIVLFDLQTDPFEDHDIAQQSPAIVARLLAQL